MYSQIELPYHIPNEIEQLKKKQEGRKDRQPERRKSLDILKLQDFKKNLKT